MTVYQVITDSRIQTKENSKDAFLDELLLANAGSIEYFDNYEAAKKCYDEFKVTGRAGYIGAGKYEAEGKALITRIDCDELSEDVETLEEAFGSVWTDWDLEYEVSKVRIDIEDIADEYAEDCMTTFASWDDYQANKTKVELSVNDWFRTFVENHYPDVELDEDEAKWIIDKATEWILEED